jgi:hypothetical protein
MHTMIETSEGTEREDRADEEFRGFTSSVQGVSRLEVLKSQYVRKGYYCIVYSDIIYQLIYIAS